MDKTRAAMQQALKVMRGISHGTDWNNGTHAGIYRPMFPETITALREALAEQAKQEPVAWRVRGYNQFKTGDPAPWRYVDGADKPAVNKPDCCDFEPLYAAPLRTKDLTPHEITALIREGAADGGWQGFAQRVIAADREKNR